MNVSDTNQIDIEQAWQQYSDSLRWFLLGVLKNETQVADVIQATFLKLMQQQKEDGLRKASSLKSWLFQVAFNEAMLIKRKSKVARDHSEKVAWRAQTIQSSRKGEGAPDADSLLQEQIEQVREAMELLSADQLTVVKKRIHEGLKFREIAEELDAPLGTVLARMHAALKKLRPFFEP